MFFATVLVCHVLGAIGVGPIFTLPFLANTPAALHAVLVLLRFGAGATLLSGILLWVVLKPDHPLWLYLSSALFVTVSRVSRKCVAAFAGPASLHRRSPSALPLSWCCGRVSREGCPDIE